MKVSITTATVAFLLFTVTACNQQEEGSAERAGEKIDEAIEEAEEQVGETAEQAAEKLEEAGDELRRKTSDY